MIILLGIIAAALTWAMFASRQSMLGFPAAIFWMLFGADAYQNSVMMWDMYYFIFFASSFGMSIFCMFAAYGLREKKDVGTDEDEYIDEKGGGKEQYYGETKRESSNSGDDLPSDRDVDSPAKPSWRTRMIRKRAADRKTGGAKKKTGWGEFK